MASPRQTQYGSFSAPEMRVEVIELRNVLPQLAALMPDAAMKVARKYLDRVYELSQRDVPVDTGALKASGHIRDEGKAIVLSYNAPNNIGIPYGAYVEYGTYKTRAQPYVNPAVEQAMPVFKDGIEEYLGGL